MICGPGRAGPAAGMVLPDATDPELETFRAVKTSG
jgi:hypothetical protein